jgi:hypothetical protein
MKSKLERVHDVFLVCFGVHPSHSAYNTSSRITYTGCLNPRQTFAQGNGQHVAWSSLQGPHSLSSNLW